MEPFIPEKLPIQSIKWDSLIPLVGQANRAIANYDGILYGVPNPGILFSPLTTKEAVLSSQIEGTRATFGEVLKHEAGEEAQEETKKSDIREILNYRRALLEAVEELKTRPFNLNLILRLHSILLEGVRGKDKSRGRFRVGQNWIGPPGCPIEQARFVPPEAGRIAESLDNWEKY